MKVYRLCRKEEAEKVLKDRKFNNIIHRSLSTSKQNTHEYIENQEYMHFFEQEISLLYLNMAKGKVICVYDIPEDMLEKSKGKGFYLDFINFENIQEVTEYAIESDKVRFEYLEQMYIINEDMDFDYMPGTDELYDRMTMIYDSKMLKTKLDEILMSENVPEAINKNMEYLEIIMPEIKNMIGFEHRHPHHHLDVWQHTLEVLRNLDSKDLELNMSALLHDIGKPFSYQDEEVRHFHGHPEVSFEMSKQILTRLGYDERFIQRVTYLVETHDTKIDPNNLDNRLEMVQKRLQLQYADARAHHPDKIQKRINFLDDINKQLQTLDKDER